MNSIAIDTHRAVKSLEQAGISEPAAEAVITTIRVVIDNMVTKTDLKNAVQGLNGRLDTTNERITGLKNVMDERSDGLKNAMDERFDGFKNAMDERFDGLKNALNGRIDTTNERIGTTNASIDGLKNTLNARIDGFEKNMDTRMELLKRSMVIQLGGIMCTAIGVVVAAMKLL